MGSERQNAFVAPEATRKIEALIAAERWSAAGRVITSALRHQPKDHWLLARLALTLYERHEYRTSLVTARRGLSIKPSCPLLLWEAAGALDMLGRMDEAIRTYRRILRMRRLTGLACREELTPALQSDCWYRIGLCSFSKGQLWSGVDALQRYLESRDSRSIYSATEARRLLGCARKLTRNGDRPSTRGGARS